MMNDDGYPIGASIRELGRLLRTGQLEPAALAEASLRRLDSIGRELNAVAELTPDQAAADARHAKDLLDSGRATPLTGIPYGVKDLVATAGIPTRWGAPPYRNQVFDFDATIVQRLRAAGAVLVAKLSMVELAGGGVYRYASASIDGPCRNPWDTERWSGGSSSGSGSAVGARLVPFAIGSETGASIIIPASFCGITALRPGFGTVSRHGAMLLSWSMDKLGPMTTSAADAELVLQGIGGWDDLDPATTTWHYRRSRRRGHRVGVLPNDFSDAPETKRAFDAALDVLRSAGCEIEPVELPAFDRMAVHDAINAAEILAEHEELITGPKLAELIDEGQKERLTAYRSRTALDYTRAMRARLEMIHHLTAIFGGVDVLVAPSVLTEATPLQADLWEYRTTRRGGYAFLGSVAGVPEISVPMGFGPAGLPLGLSFIAPVGAENILIRLARTFQDSTDWHRRLPPAAAGHQGRGGVTGG